MRRVIQAVQNYEERLYSDVQLAARRSLASMTLEEILTNRHRLNEDILRDVKEAAVGYGVTIHRADIKDLVFPGNLQEIMNRVLAAERMSQVQLVEARTTAEVQRIEAEARTETERRQSNAEDEMKRQAARTEAELERLRAEADGEVARLASEHPTLLGLRELETLRQLAGNARARIYVGFGRSRRRPRR